MTTHTAPQITAPNGAPMSKLCFGAMQFGGTADAQASAAMFTACRDAGVNFFDTAHGYTGGTSERWLGEYAASERDALIIASKAGYTGGSGGATIRAQVDESRTRLGMDCIDILYLHRWDPDTPLEETFGALLALRDTGAIRHIGVSNFAAWQVMKAQAVAAKLGMRIDILQPMYSLVKRQAEVEILPMCASEGMLVAPYSPLGGGLLTGKYASGAGEDARLITDSRYAARYGPDWMHDSAAALAREAEAQSMDPPTLAVAWAAHHPAVTAPIVSARNTAQLAPSLAAMDVTLSEDQYARISGLSPTPPPATDRLEEA